VGAKPSAEGARIEAPKASRGWVAASRGGDFPLPTGGRVWGGGYAFWWIPDAF